MAGGLIGAALCAPPASAQNRSFCADPPSGERSVCTLAAGDAMLELAAISFDTGYDPIARNDTLTFGDALLRYGLDDASELQVGISALVHASTRDRANGAAESARGMGDSYLALRRTMGERLAIEIFVTVPSGQAAAGAGDWGAGLLLPIDIPAPEGFEYSLIPQIDATPNASGVGRHLSLGGTVGFSHALRDNLAAAVEFAAFQDDDPQGAALAADVVGSLAWRAGPRLQLNAEVNFGRAHGQPRASAFLGFAFRL